MTDVLDLSYGLLMQALEMIPEAALGCDSQGTILSGNGEAERLLHCSNGDLEGKKLCVFLPTVGEWEGESSFLDMVRMGVLDSEQGLVTSTGTRKLIWSRSRLLAAREGAKHYVILTIRDITSRSLHERRLQELSVTDELTGLHNRRYLNSVLDFEEERARRFGHYLACVFIDVDRFKAINDNHGHHVGDEALKALADVLKANTRKIDTICRWGGDEFVVIALVKESVGLKALLDRLVTAASATEIKVGDASFFLTISIGAAVGLVGKTIGAASLLDEADEQLRKAKTQGRNRVLIRDFGRD